MKKVSLLVCFLLMVCLSSLRAQTLTVDDTVSPNNLVTNLISSNCDTVSGTVISNDGSGQSVNSYGSFTAANNPNFSLANGMVLTTGTAVNAGTSGALNIDGDITNWFGSTVYENELGLLPGTTFNATEIEFSFTALKNNVTIDYVFASEEYVLNSLCARNEGMVMLIKEATAPDTMYANIAIIPGTNDPVTVANIHAERVGVCAAVNESYLGGARGFSTPFPNYSQYTTTLQAHTNSVMGTDYTIKIIIADEEDGNYDSAVFIGTIDNEQETPVSASYVSDGSPVAINSNTINECGQGIVLQLDATYPASYTYEWYHEAVVISGENTATLTVNTSGTYHVRVYQSASCFSEEAIVVNLSANQPGNDLDDMEACVPSGSSAVFVLGDQDSFALAGRSAVNVDYYINNTLIPAAQELGYTGNNGDVIEAVVIEASGCEYRSTFTLNVEINGAFLDSSGYDFSLCDDPINNDGFVAVYSSDLEGLLPVLTTGSYTFYDQSSTPFNGGIGAVDGDLLRVDYNSVNGCISSADIRIQVGQPPNVTVGTIEFIEVCDDGSDLINGVARDGFATFDLTPKRDEIQAELDLESSAATIVFYPSMQLAQNGNSGTEIPNADIGNYENDASYTLEQLQIVGIRIENPDGCFILQSLQLRPRYLLTNINIEDFLMCDPEGDGLEDFDLAEKKIEIAGSNNYAVSFFKSFAEAEANSNELTDAIFTNETADRQRLWFRIEDLDTGCVDYDEDLAYIDLIVNPQPSINTPTSTLDPLCAPGSSGVVDGLVTYFNDQVAAEITSDSSLSLNYYFTQPDPNDESATPRISNTDNNVASSMSQTYWAMAENVISGCFSDPVSFELQVNPAPIIDNANPNTIAYCYDGTDTDPRIPIDAEKDNIVLPANQTDVLFSYFTTEDLAITGDDADKLDETNFFTDTNTSIWYRIEYGSTGCFVVVGQSIIVNVKPVIDPIDDFLLCVDPGETQAGFLLSSQDATVLNGQIGMVVRYYETAAEANSGGLAGEISKNIPFNANDDTEIFVRVENDDDPDCYNDQGVIPSFRLKIAEYATTGSATPELIECGVLGFAEFDLQTIINDITNNGAVSLASIKFYEDPNDAQYQDPVPNNVQVAPAVVGSEITDTDNNPNTLLFTNSTASSQQIVVRIESVEGCTTFQTFNLLINEVPFAQAINNIPVCDTDGDGTELYNLTTIENLSDLDFSQMLRPYTNINEVEINYFTSEIGRDTYASDDTSTLDKINNPSNFTLNTIGLTPIYITINDAVNNTCVFSTMFNLDLKALPVITPQPVAICEDALGSNQFVLDLDTLNADFGFYTDGDADVRLDYFSDAAGTTPISGQFTKTTSTTAIYLQAVNTRTNCTSHSIIEIPLTANGLPTVTAPSNTEAITCDNDGVNDGTTVFDLSSLSTIVLNGQNPMEYSVVYYNAASAEMLPNSEVTNAETYTAVITNTTTACESSVDFVFTVNQLPEIEALNSVDFCDDDEDTTNTSIIDLTEVVAGFNYTTSEQASANGIQFYSDVQRLNEITTPNSYDKTGDLDEVIYLNITSANDCTYQTDFTIQMNPMPVINVDSSVPFVFCEDTFGSSQYTFVDLDNDIATVVLDDPSLYTITYHTDITATSANEILAPHSTSDTTIYVKAVSAFGCENVEPVSIQVSPIPSVNSITSSTDICDIDGVNDGAVIYDFNIYKAELLGSQNETDFNVSYHQSEQQAEDDIPFNLTEITTGTYYVKIQNKASLCYAIGSFDMTINMLPEIDDEEIFFCVNNPSRVFDKDTGNPTDTYLWQFSGGRASENASSVSLSFADVGTVVTLTVTNSLTNCSNSNDFEILTSPTPEIEPLVTKNFDTNEAVIKVSEPGDYLYALTKTAIIPDASQAQESNVFTDLLPGKYYAHVIDLNACGDIEPLEVNFVDYYPFFTPDGNGPLETETFHIQSIEEIPDTIAYIYNRYGVLMHTLYSGSPGWDGNYNGKPMPSDDYWILIELPDGEGTIKDHITLKR